MLGNVGLIPCRSGLNEGMHAVIIDALSMICAHTCGISASQVKSTLALR